MALFGSGVRTASVTSRTPCALLMLDRRAYQFLRDANNPVAQAIEDGALATLTERLRDVGARITRLAEGSDARAVTPDPGVLRRIAKLFGGGGGRASASFDAAAVLKQSPMFAGGSEPAMVALAARMKAFRFSTGHFLCTQGEFGREMFVLAKGQVEVLAALDETRVEPLATLEIGDAFGTVSVIGHIPRMASCVSKGPVDALSLDVNAYREAILESGGAGSLLRTAIIRSLIDQIAYANGQLAMLDIEKRRKQGDVLPILRASAGIDAHGRHLQTEG
jgi:CRP-like cAMP-binding protein